MTIKIPSSKIYERLGITLAQLDKFCQKWQIQELSLFGSILREDFQADSDIDFLVTYQPTAKRGLLEKIKMKEDLSSLVRREVDLVSKKAIERSSNWLRRSNILNSAEVIYVARSRIPN
jgi:uncharacterized protein